MVWVKLEDTYADGPKIAALTDGAFRLNLTATCWSNKLATDGFVPEAWVPMIRPRDGVQCVRELLAPPKALPDAEPLWHLSTAPCTGCQERWGYASKPGGYWIHDHVEYQKTAEEWEELRAKKAAAGRIGGLRSGARRKRMPEQMPEHLPGIGPSSGEAQDGARAEAGASARPKHGRSNGASKPEAVPRTPSGNVPPSEAVPVPELETADPGRGAGLVVAAYARGLKGGGHEPCDPKGRRILGDHAEHYLAGPRDARILQADWYHPLAEFRWRMRECVRAAEAAGLAGKNPAFLTEWLDRQQAEDEQLERVRDRAPRRDGLHPIDVASLGGAA